MEDYKIGVYVRTDSNNNIIEINSDIFINDLTGWLKIDEGNFIVYVHTNKINGKCYVGITNQTPMGRWRSNGSGYFRSPHFYLAINEYGWDCFEHKILHSGVGELWAKRLERYYIKNYNSRDRLCGYNMTDGGDGSWGYIVGPATREKISNANKGKKHSDECKKKISIAHTGKTFSLEHRKRLSESHLGNKLSPYALDISRQTLKNNVDKMKKPIFGIDADGNKIEFNSIAEASIKLNTNLNKRFSSIVKGKYLCCGYRWFYKENTNVQ